MPDAEMRADPLEIARLAAEVLTAADGLTNGYNDAVAGLALPAAAFGNSDGGGGAFEAFGGAVDQTGTAAGRLIEVLEGDVDRLYHAAFAYAESDRRAAERACGPRMGGTQVC